MRILLLGGTGLIGRRLACTLVARGDDVTVLSRRADGGISGLPSLVALVKGDPCVEGPWQQELEHCDAVINLVGEGVMDVPWTLERKTRLKESRTLPTRHVVEGLKRASRRPSVFINASAVGYYGDRGEEVLTEASTPDGSFLSTLCQAWEAEANEAESLGVRTVVLRIGVVLSPRGGALEPLALPFRFFVGGSVGNPSAFFPWIHLDDVVGLCLFALDQEMLRGPVNAVAPEAITMGRFSKTLGRLMHRPSWMTVPALALKLLLGERAAVLLSSQHVHPSVALNAGYPFRFPQLEGALKDLV